MVPFVSLLHTLQELLHGLGVLLPEQIPPMPYRYLHLQFSRGFLRMHHLAVPLCCLQVADAVFPITPDGLPADGFLTNVA